MASRWACEYNTRPPDRARLQNCRTIRVGGAPNRGDNLGMSIQPQTLSEQEQRAIVAVCILAAFADGAQDETERAQIEKTVKGFADVDLTSVYQDVLGGKQTLGAAAAQLQAPAAKALAYEMAV